MNCRQASQLLSEALERALTHEEQDEIERHLAICPPCLNCRKQFLELRRALRRFANPA